MNNLLDIEPKKEVGKITKFLKNTFQKQGINRVVIGISGGIDSTVSLFLLKKILPKHNIIAIHLPYYHQNENIGLIEKSSGIKIKTVSIKNGVDALKNIVFSGDISKRASDSAQQFLRQSRLRVLSGKKFMAEPEKIRLGNIMARVRMVILFDLAKKYNALVCGTENKSEHLLGYFTRYGDGASDIEPIRHLYKTQIFQLAKFLNIPAKIISQKPSADLWKNQTDEKEFGFGYEEADYVLTLYFDQKNTISKIIKMGYLKAEKIIKFAKKNSFKQKVPYTL